MKSFRTDLNGLRAVAVVAVVLFHATVKPFGGGFVGVDIFFVISGFLMTQIILGGLDRGRFSLLAFWAARARRIVPALLVLCAALAAFGWFFIEPITYRELAAHVAASLSFVSNIQYWRETGYFDESAEAKWLLHTWSLSVEWQFYLLYPIVLVLAHRFLGRRWIVPLLWIGFATSLALSAVVTAWRPAIAFYMLPARAWEMIGGGLVLVHGARLGAVSTPLRRGLELLGLATLALSIVAIGAQWPWPSYWALLPVLGTMAVIAADRGPASLLNRPVAQTLGTWSYSIYLWHWPVIVAFRYFDWHDARWAAPAEIAIGLALGGLSYAFVERNAQSWLKALSSPLTLGALAACAAAMLVWSGATWRTDGFVARAPHPVLQADYVKARSDWFFPEGTCARAGRDHSIHVCTIGRDSADGTLVIGDSHANQWYARVADHDDQNAVFVTRDGCPPLPDMRLTPGPDCEDFYKTAMLAASDGHFKRIVITSFWASYFRPSTIDDAVCVVSPKGCLSLSRYPEGMADVFKQFSADLATLSQHSEIVLVLPDLEPPGDLPVLLSKRAFLGRSTSDLTEESRATVRAKTEQVRQALIGVAEQVHATVVDPLDDMCGAATCRFVAANGEPLFKDSNHLRASVVKAEFSFLDRYFR